MSIKKSIASKWVHETLYPNYRQSFAITKVLVDKHTKYQRLQLFDTESHGKVLMLDGVVQLTERDEFIYHEMLVHVPLLAHPKPQRVLIIGGGDGGVAKRVLMHPNVKVTLVEIDPEVIALSKKYLKSLSKDVFTNERLTVVYDDAAHYIAETKERFNVILSDRGDPIGPVQTLFEKTFYKKCKHCLKPDGVLVSLTGVPFMQREELSESFKYLKTLFVHNACYTVPVPTYIGGLLALTWSSDFLKPDAIDIKQLHRKVKKLETRYYTPELHLASFVLPKNIKSILE